MTSSEAPKGMRFSHVYLHRPDLLSDSERMRRRLGSLIASYGVSDLGATLEAELGIQLAANSHYKSNWPTIVEALTLGDALDTITVRYRTLRVKNAYGSTDEERTKILKRQFLHEVKRIFTEEGVQYSVDELGGVHFTVDAQFEQSRASVIGALTGTRYANVRDSFDKCLAALDHAPPDGKAAIRFCFFAAEGLYCLMFPKRNQLKSAFLAEDLKYKLDKVYGDQKPANFVAQKQLSSFREWIDAAHFYRHEPGSEEVAQPPLEIAIEMVSIGAALIRWLAHVDATGVDKPDASN